MGKAHFDPAMMVLKDFIFEQGLMDIPLGGSFLYVVK
jgi:hypothetical protein